MSEDPGFYYNLTTGAVEEGRQSHAPELMGPYATRGEAERALEIAATRNQAWEQEEQAWEDGGEPPADADDAR